MAFLPDLTPSEQSPIFSGMNAYHQMMQNMYLQPQMQQELQKQKLANALSQIQLPYAGPQAAADLAYRQAQTPNLQASTQSTLAGIPLIQAQARYYGPKAEAEMNLQRAHAGQLNEQAKYIGLGELLKAQNAYQQSSRFGQSYQLAKALSSMAPAARNSWIADNQQAYNQMLADLGNKQANPNFLTPQIMEKYFPGINQNSQQASENIPSQNVRDPIVNPIQNNIHNYSPISPNMGQGYGFSVNPSTIAKTQLANQLAANNALTTAATKRQNEGAIQVAEILNNPGMQDRALNAAQYAGAYGKGKAALAALSQKNPKAYEDYINFKNTDMVLLENRIKTLDQMGGTDKQREELKGLYKRTMDSLTSNPEQFITQFNKLGESLGNVARGVQKSASPLYKINRAAEFNPIGNRSNAGSGVVRVRMDDGSEHEIDSAHLEAAKRKYGNKLQVVG